jgi:hypothetical protein
MKARRRYSEIKLFVEVMMAYVDLFLIFWCAIYTDEEKISRYYNQNLDKIILH